MKTPLGEHSLLDYLDCDTGALNDTGRIRAALLRAVREAGGTIVTDAFHTFSPHGVSGVVVIAESHVTIHTWPEHGYAAVDIFTCGVSLDHTVIVSLIKDALGAGRVEERSFARGLGGTVARP